MDGELVRPQVRVRVRTGIRIRGEVGQAGSGLIVQRRKWAGKVIRWVIVGSIRVEYVLGGSGLDGSRAKDVGVWCLDLRLCTGKGKGGDGCRVES